MQNSFEGLPHDPLADQEAQRVASYVQDIDEYTKEKGLTWSQYTAGLIDVCISGPAIIDPVLAQNVGQLQDRLPALQEAETTGDPQLMGLKHSVAANMYDMVVLSDIRNRQYRGEE